MKTGSLKDGGGRPAAAGPLQQKRAENQIDYNELLEPVHYDFGLTRRSFAKILGTGLLLVISAPALAQERRRRGGGGFFGRGAKNIAARLHIGTDGVITLMVGKVEAGQGSSAEFTQAAAEELRVPASQVALAPVDTSLVPDDGMTAGSGSTPRTVPPIRQAGAAVRELLIDFAAKQWGVGREGITVGVGKATDAAGKRSLSYADFAKSEEAGKDFAQAVSGDVTLTNVKDWKVMGTSLIRPNARAIVTGEHQYPSDISRPGMLYGKVLRAPSYGAKLTSVDAAAAKSMKGVTVAQSEGFVGVTAPTSFAAENALDALAKTAKWEMASQVSSKELFGYLKEHAEGGVPANPFADELPKAAKVLRASYDVAYAQHAPLEPRAAVAEWAGKDALAVWTGTQNPFGVRAELARAFHLPEERVRVIVPDFGAAFGGKHTGEMAVEAARLAQAAGKPVSLRWTRVEEFTWAYFRPAAAIEIEASVDTNGKLTTWHFVNINSGNAALETPYAIAKHRSQYVQSQPPLRHGSYRGLASTANNFARECFMDELATAAGADPLEFRLAHLENPRLRAVLQTAAEKFDWKERVKKTGAPIGLSCGVEKGGYVAACVEIELDAKNQFRVKHVCQAFECGAIVNPDNLMKQVQGAIIMGLGPALREEVRFENGENQTVSFRSYSVPRYEDAPELDVHLINRTDLPSAGAGETPIMCIAPAIANAVFRATGKRVRTMPVRAV
ncbi:MAG TPA: molybdopterin cofactor-binding domain-containing protein [Candidatus Angelobacter sp.]|nr:molybdopterin cofactor-binding domain-containing protein [Candidatus Angelobacter sp.]